MRNFHLHRSHPRIRSERGTAMVELAIILPVFMLLLLGMLDFGDAYNSWIDETHLANEGARLAAVNYSVAGCTNANVDICLAQYVQANADTTELKNGRTGDSYAPTQNAARVCISYPQNTANSPATQGQIGDPVQVTVSVDYEWLKYITGRLNIPGGKTTIQGKATMRLEQPAPSAAAAITSCSS